MQYPKAVEPPISIKDIYGDKEVPVRVIDISACQPFGKNVFGHPRSEISFLRENAQSALQESIAKSMIYEKVNGSNLDGSLSVSQQFDSIRARNQQTAAELQDYILATGAIADKIEAERKAKEFVEESVVESVTESSNE